MTELTGKRALVTGASRGIGRAIAIALRAQGAEVIGTVGRSRDEALAVEQEHGVGFIAVDLEASDAAEQVAAEISGDLDILVNNAGVASFIGWGDNTAAMVDREFAINVRAPLLLTQKLGPRIRDSGRILFLSSIVAERSFGEGALVAYSATKGAVDSMVKQLAGPFGARGITVNAIAPGAIDTDMSAWLRDEGGAEQAHSIQALKRVGQAKDVADAIAFFAGDDSRWITGQTIQVGGGTLV